MVFLYKCSVFYRRKSSLDFHVRIGVQSPVFVDGAGEKLSVRTLRLDVLCIVACMVIMISITGLNGSGDSSTNRLS